MRRFPGILWALRLGCLVVALTFGGAIGARAADEPYALSTGDKLRIVVHARPDLSGEFTIDPSSTLAVPVLGRMQVEGLSLVQLEDMLADRLLQKAGLKDPNLSVEIMQHRPFFILGAVEAAGQYPYVAGMTVLHAISIASGFRKPSPQDVLLVLEVSRARERYQLAGESTAVALARRARLVAERDGGAEIAFSPMITELVGAARADALAAHEKNLMAQRSASLQAELDTIEKQKGVIADEMDALQGLLVSKETQSKLTEQELAQLDSLRQRDLIPVTRLLALRRLAAELEGDRRQLLAFLARARQETTKVDLTILNLRKARNIQIAETLKQTDDELSQLEISRRAAADQLGRAEITERRTTARLSAGDPGADVIIVRRGPNGPVEISASDHTPVLPGDIVKIPAPAPSRGEFDQGIKAARAP